jgi:hypothetical protein
MKYKAEYQPSELLEPVCLKFLHPTFFCLLLNSLRYEKYSNVFMPWTETRAWFEQSADDTSDPGGSSSAGEAMVLDEDVEEEDEEVEEEEDDDDEEGIPSPPPPGMLDPAKIDWPLDNIFVIEDRRILPAMVSCPSNLERSQMLIYSRIEGHEALERQG